LLKAAAQVEADVDALSRLLPDARKSREAMTADEYSADQDTLGALTAEGLGAVDPDSLRGFKLGELQERLATIHALQPQIRQLLEKYQRR
jgi:hypothetical protein